MENTDTQDTLRYLAQVEDFNRPTRSDYQAWFDMMENNADHKKRVEKCQKK